MPPSLPGISVGGVTATMHGLAGLVEADLTAADPGAFGTLLAVDARWGPADEWDWGCRRRGMAAHVE